VFCAGFGADASASTSLTSLPCLAYEYINVPLSTTFILIVLNILDNIMTALYVMRAYLVRVRPHITPYVMDHSLLQLMHLQNHAVR